ncbi:MAG TPA: hypothetical protein VK971_11165 [Thiohalobacter sp.]|nr:hypothetical protein [Thiohalobacter sp.]
MHAEGHVLLAAWRQSVDLVSQWVWALIYTAMVLILFFTRGRKPVGQVLTRYRQDEAENA